MTAEASHRWLERLVGDWTFEARSAGYRGTEQVRSLGGVWVVCESRGEIPGAEEQTTLTTLGYDAERGRFVGTVVGSMMSYIWSYEGELQPDGNTLRLETEGPSYEDESVMTSYVDVIELIGEDERELRSSYLGADGGWHEVMTTRYHRQR